MTVEKTIKFETLAFGTELETSMGIGKFVSYKKGNFKKQNVLVEHTPFKRKWYPEHELKLASKRVSTPRELNSNAFMTNVFYYAL